MDNKIFNFIQEVDLITEDLSKLKVLEMKHESSADLSDKRILFRLKLDFQDPATKQAVSVKSYESAVLTLMGQLIGVIPEGLWTMDDKYFQSSSEVIWIDQTEFKTKWGVFDVFLSDNIKIGAFGFLLLKISKPEDLVLNLISSKEIVERDQLDQFIFNSVSQTFKEILGSLTIDEVVRSREVIKISVSEKLHGFLDHYGIELINLEVNGVKIPKEYEELGKITLKTKIQKLEKTSERELLEEEIETIKVKKELKSHQYDLDSGTMINKSDIELIIEEIKGMKHEMHDRFDSVEDILGDILVKIPNNEEFLAAIYNEDHFEHYLNANKELLAEIKNLTAKSNNSEKVINILIEKTLEQELEYDINLEGGIEEKEVYVVGKPFNAEIILNPKLSTEISSIKSTLSITSAWFGEEEKNIQEGVAQINEKIYPGKKHVLELELDKPAELSSLLIEVCGEITIEENCYPISLITDPLDVKAGKVKWIKTKKVLKKGIKFLAPKITKKVSALLNE